MESSSLSLFPHVSLSTPHHGSILSLSFSRLTLTIAVFTLVSGGLLGKVGYYQPFLLVGAAIVAIGSGPIYTLDVNTSTAKSIGYQFLAGVGDGSVSKSQSRQCRLLPTRKISWCCVSRQEASFYANSSN